MRKYFGVIEMRYILIVGVFTQVCTFVKVHQIVHLKGVYFILHKLYLNKCGVFLNQVVERTNPDPLRLTVRTLHNFSPHSSYAPASK